MNWWYSLPRFSQLFPMCFPMFHDSTIDPITNDPLVNDYITLERSTMFNGKTHELSMAIFNSKLLVITRGYHPLISRYHPYSIIPIKPYERVIFSLKLVVMTRGYINHIQILSIDYPYTNHMDVDYPYTTISSIDCP